MPSSPDKTEDHAPRPKPFDLALSRTAWRRIRLSLAAMAGILLVAAWLPLLIGNKLDHSDPSAVGGRFVAELQHRNINKAYALTSTQFQARHSYDDFDPELADDITAAWPAGDAIYRATKDAGESGKIVSFIIASDGQLKAQQINIQMVLENDSWRVNDITSITNTNGKLEPGAI